MAERTVELLIKILAEGGQLKAVVSGAQNDLRNLGQAAERAGKQASSVDAQGTAGIGRIGQTAAVATREVTTLGQAGADAGRAVSGGLDGATASMRRLVVQVGAGFLSLQGLRALFSEFTRVATDFERARVQLNSLFGDAAKGQAAFAWVKQFAVDTPFELQDVLTAFQTLKNFGIDPMGGAMQAVADQASLFGGTQVQLQGISLALGQAWARQKLQGQDILQLINQGVPVWELLAQVTGRNTQELFAMSEAGELGRDVIEKFIAAMGEAAGGAAQAKMATFGGLVSNVKDAWAQFLDEIGQSGALDEMKAALDDLLTTTGDLAGSGDLQSFAAQIGSGLGSLIGLGRDAANVLASMSGPLKVLAELWVAGKVLAYGQALAALAVNTGAAAAASRTAQAAAAADAAAALSSASAKAAAADAVRLHAAMLVAEAEAAVASATGMARLTAAQNLLLPARARLTAATAAHEAALIAEATAATAAQAAIARTGVAATAAAATLSTASKVATGALVGLGAALTSLGRIIAALPMLILIDQVAKLGLVAVEHRDTVRGIADDYEQFRRTQQRLIDSNKEFAGAQVKTASEIAGLSRAEQDAYATRLKSAQTYYQAVFQLEARRPDGDEALARQAFRQVRVYEQALRDLQPVLDERLRNEQAAADRVAQLKADETKAIEAELARQKAAYDAANDAIRAANNERDRLIKDAADLVADVSTPAAGRDPTILDALSGASRAEAALRRGDLEETLRLTKATGDVLRDLAKDGNASQLVQQTAKRVADAQVAAATAQAEEIKAQREAEIAQIQATMDDLATRAKTLEALKVGFDQAQAITDAQALRAALEAELAANPITVQVVLDTSNVGADLIDKAVPVPAKADGGELPGRSPHPRADNILFWGTAGEYLLPVDATRSLRSLIGAEGLEMLRRGRLPGYALGGQIGAAPGRLPSLLDRLPAVPSLPAGAVPAGGGNQGPYSVVNVDLGGRRYSLRAPPQTATDFAQALRLERLKG